MSDSHDAGHEYTDQHDGQRHEGASLRSTIDPMRRHEHRCHIIDRGKRLGGSIILDLIKLGVDPVMIGMSQERRSGVHSRPPGVSVTAIC